MVKRISALKILFLLTMLAGCSIQLSDNKTNDDLNGNTPISKPSLENNDLFFLADIEPEPASSIKDVTVTGHYMGRIDYLENSASNSKTDKLFSFLDEDLYVWTEEKYNFVENVFYNKLLEKLNETDKNKYQELFAFPTLGYFASNDEIDSAYYVFIVSKDHTVYSFELSLDEASFEVLAIYKLINKRFDPVESLYELDGKPYGRLIASSESSEDAVRVCTRHFTDLRSSYPSNVVVECNVIYESDILYGVYVKWKHSGSYYYEENVISLKKSVAEVTVRNVIYGDEPSYTIKTTDQQQFMKVLSYITINVLPYQVYQILFYDIVEDDDQIVIDYYSRYFVRGDYGIPNYFVYWKTTATYDKATGNITYGEIIGLKEVVDKGLF